jgi:hypothetical protein
MLIIDVASILVAMHRIFANNAPTALPMENKNL